MLSWRLNVITLWCIVLVVGLCATAIESVPWVSPALERMDEIRDAEIYDAVLTSVKEWQDRKQRKNAAYLSHHRREKREEASVCYAEVGCFEASGPFGYLDMLPSPPDEIATKFLLYPSPKNRRNGLSHAEVPSYNLTDAFVWAKQGFNKSLPTKVLIHGFGSDCTHVWVYELRSALMAVEEMNIVCVDWSNGAALPNYVKAAANTRLVGKQLAKLLNGLIEHAGITAKTMHLIGFSLGAHVAGFAGAEVKNLSRITGLDPAGPLFESQDPRARLDQSDALFVDVIHSNGENLILGGLGSWQPLGHVDFYPNGGRMQKGCTNLFVGAVSDIIWSSAIEGRSLCNHRRAYKFFTDSVSPRCHFPAFPCDSYESFLEGRCFPCSDDSNCGKMGYYADRSSARGQLYLITRDEEPFCAHQYHVKIESSTSDIPITSYGKIQLTLVGDSELNETFVMTKKDDEEMKLGHSISRILVPHPILADLSKIQILYTAYSGWLSSGLQHWRIDRITLSDSYGKSTSICKKSLVLQSGVPITLPLYPGICNIPEDEYQQAQDKMFDQNATDSRVSVKTASKFVPTPVVKIGNEAIRSKNEQHKISNNKVILQDAFDIFNIPWQPFMNEKDNRVDDDKESSRALNTRPILKNSAELGIPQSQDKYEYEREIVEPVLKPHSNKIGRSHNLDKDKHEISEPILGPTTSRTNQQQVFTPVTEYRNKKEFTYNFYDSNFEDDWIPSVPPQEQIVKHRNSDKWKRQDDSKVITGFNQYSKPHPPPLPPPQHLPPEIAEDNSAFNFITMTVQFLPQRIARMFEQAEKYARETILPFVSAHAPKIIRDFIAPEEKPKYLPLHFEEPDFGAVGKRPTSLHKQRGSSARRIAPTTFSPPVTTAKFIPTTIGSVGTITTTIATITTTAQFVPPSTPPPPPTTLTHRERSNIQKIKRQNSAGDRINPIPFSIRTTSLEGAEVGKSFKDVLLLPQVLGATGAPVRNRSSAEIYINLPVFDDDGQSPKYIPLQHEHQQHQQHQRHQRRGSASNSRENKDKT